jgi:hypothetical protein
MIYFRKLLKSKTMIFSVLLAGLGALEMNIGVIPAEYRGHALILIAMATAWLRFVTAKPLSDK